MIENFKENYFKLHNVRIIPANKKCTTVGIFFDTGDLVYNDYISDIPRGLPIYLLFVEKHSPKESLISNYFLLFPEYDEVYYTKFNSLLTPNKNSITGKKCSITENGLIPDGLDFDFPIENVRFITASTDSQDFYRMKQISFNTIELKNFIIEYNKNPHIYFDG